MVVVAGTPGSGKTSVLMHAVRELLRSGHKPALAKIDCMWTEDDIRFKRLNVPVAVGLSRDMCPDHYAIYNVDEMLQWARARMQTSCSMRPPGSACAVLLIRIRRWQCA